MTTWNDLLYAKDEAARLLDEWEAHPLFQQEKDLQSLLRRVLAAPGPEALAEATFEECQSVLVLPTERRKNVEGYGKYANALAPWINTVFETLLPQLRAQAVFLNYVQERENAYIALPYLLQEMEAALEAKAAEFAIPMEQDHLVLHQLRSAYEEAQMLAATLDDLRHGVPAADLNEPLRDVLAGYEGTIREMIHLTGLYKGPGFQSAIVMERMIQQIGLLAESLEAELQTRASLILANVNLDDPLER
ncbi:MAG: hypothetical protein J0L97_05195 [Alphaproteobacteria bacterium]|nr:hypothetical protein [Alphaproteobacteria bacterium]